MSRSSLTVEWIGDPARFADLAADWDALLPADSHPFDLHGWYEAWWGAFGGAQEIAVCTVWRDGKLASALPLRTEGRHLKGLVNGHSGMFRPLATDEEAMEAVVEAAMRRRAASFEMSGLPAEDCCVAQLRTAARAASRTSLLEASYVSPIVDTDGDFDAWRAQSKRRWGAPLERFRRKMGRDHEADFAIVEAPRELDAWLDDGFRVEASGWKGEEGTAILSAPETETFYRDVAHRFHERDELRLSRIVLDGDTAAFDYCLLHRNRLYLLKTGYDERFRRLAPGLVMRLSIVERCFELGLAAHELLGYGSEWKLKFANAERPHTVFRAYPRRPLGIARHAYRRTLRPALKGAYRRLRPRGR